MKLGQLLGNATDFIRQAFPALILAICLLTTFVLGANQRQFTHDALDREFTARAQEIYERINGRLEDFGHILSGSRGLFASGGPIGRKEWHNYVGSLNIEQDIPGLQGLGFAPVVKPEDQSSHTEEIRNEGFSEYSIKPDGQRDAYSPVIYLEPFSGRNLRAFGYDTSSEPIRRSAMEAARDEDRIAMSGKVKLVQETESDVQAGFLFYAPVYRNGTSHATLKERQETLTGWVSAPIRMNDFMKPMVGNGFLLNGIYLDIIVCDGDGIDANSVLYHYDNDIDPVITGGRTPLLMFRRVMTFGGHSWTIVVHSPRVFDSQYFDNKATLIEVFGAIISLLVSAVSWLLMSGGGSRRNRRQGDAEPLPPGEARLERAAPYALAAALSLAAGLVVVKTDDTERQARSHTARTEDESRLNDIRLHLERTLVTAMVRTRAMASQIVAHGDVSSIEFGKAAEMLLHGQSAIRNIGVSHGTRLDMIYPQSGNEGALGTDYRSIERQWPMVRRAIETRSTVVVGPVRLIQGGTGLIVREPVFLPGPQGGESHLFGLVSIVLNLPVVYAEAGLDRDDLPIKVAIRGRDGLGAHGEMIRGEASTFTEDPVEADVQFPFGSWRLAAVPRHGWGRAEPLFPVSRLLGGGFFLFVVLVSFGTAHHVIERRLLLDRVGMSEERFRSLLRIASDGVHILDPDGKLVMWSDAFVRMLGYSEEEARRLSVFDWDTVFVRDELIPSIRHLIGHPAVFETRHRRRDGSEFDVEINACGIELGGRTYLYASSRDISERKLHEEEIRHARFIAEQADKAKSDFLAVMSHEIRTPITSVLGMADLLAKTPLSEEQGGYLAILRSATGTLLAILNDILDISKIEAGKVEIEATVFPLHDAIREVVELERGTASAKGLNVNLDISQDVPAVVVGDPTRVKQVLFNLLGNAVKFTERGSVTVRMSARRTADRIATVAIDISDTGIGISGEQMAGLFTAFSQADRTTTRRFGGTGLGLAISKKLVELMGGEIGVESESGVGTTFHIALPFEIEDAAEFVSGTVVPPLPAQPMRLLRILLAEDNRINRMMVQSMLRKSGHEVTVAEDGRQALNAVIAGDFDIVLMDMQMPEMDGEEATSAIRALPPPRNRVPVLALTADVMAEHRDRYLRAGVDDLVAKPIDWRILSGAIEAHTRKAVEAGGMPDGSKSGADRLPDQTRRVERS